MNIQKEINIIVTYRDDDNNTKEVRMVIPHPDEVDNNVLEVELPNSKTYSTGQLYSHYSPDILSTPTVLILHGAYRGSVEIRCSIRGSWREE